jgi:hypothetical protein
LLKKLALFSTYSFYPEKNGSLEKSLNRDKRTVLFIKWIKRTVLFFFGFLFPENANLAFQNSTE